MTSAKIRLLKSTVRIRFEVFRSTKTMAVTKCGTGTWDVGRGTWGRGDLGTWGRGDVGTRGRGDARVSELGDARGFEEVINK